MDRQWWRLYHFEASRVFRGELVAPIEVDGVHRERFRPCRSSGEGALALAAHRGARRIILLGYDCQHTGGRAHWHPDHPGIGNAKKPERWHEHFRKLARDLGAAVEIVNATRETALRVFPLISLEAALERDQSRHREKQAAGYA